MGEYCVAWWNVENLFDEEDAPQRTDKLRRALGSSLTGWTPALRDRKVAQLASVVARIDDGRGPDLLGVCEVEDAVVMGKLRDAVAALVPSRDYAVAHADTSDDRGIDVAFLYDAALLTAPPDQRFQHVVMRRNATREIFQVNFRTHRGRTWTVFGNHWPSRTGGRYESAGYRATAGETLAYFHQRVREVHGEGTPVLVMGDFNDEPSDESLVRHALSTRQPARVLRGSKPYLLNLTLDAFGEGMGTFYFDNEPNVLDQVLVNAAMLRAGAPLRVRPDSVELVSFPGMVADGAYPVPVRFGGMGKPVNPDGYSDHSPVTVRVDEDDD